MLGKEEHKMELITSIPNGFDFGAQRKGSARGAVICGVFGAVWILEAAFFGHMANPASLTAILLLAGAFVAWPVTRLRSLRHVTIPPADRRRWKAIATTYWTNLAIEWLACTAACIWLAHIRRYDLIPQS